MMKTGVLAVSYDQSPKAFAKKMSVTDDVAAMFFENFDRSFPSFRQMVADIRQFMRDYGYVETLFGRKRRFPDYKATAAAAKSNDERLIRLYTERKQIRNKTVQTARDVRRLDELEAQINALKDSRGLVGYWERAAFNAVIQGSGADILKMNGNRMARICKDRGWELNASIHDELLISVKNEDLTPDTIELVRDVMTNSVELSVPLVTDIVIMKRWMDEVKPEDWDYENHRPKPQGEAI
jgi:DNA polymerase-1